MKTTLDIVDILYQHLKNSSLASEIDGGGIYKHRKPANSEKECIVINSLPINNEQLQNAVANINIHVPNKKQKVNNVQDSSLPDHARLKELTGIAVEELEHWAEEYNFSVQQQVLIQDEETLNFYINVRLDFYSINI